MKVTGVFFRTIALAAALGFAAACSDDDDDGGPSVPETPTGLAAVLQDDGSVEVTWNEVADATSYILERNEDGGDFAEVGGSLTTATFSDTDITEGVEYGYRVAAVNAIGTSAFSSPVTVTSEGPAVRTISEDITADQTLFADTTYTLSGFIKVTEGATLTIEPGTTIMGDAATPGSSLWILRGARIDAQGTVEAPIVFTSSNAAGSRAPGDWGGVVIIGNGIINRSGVVFTEGPIEEQEDYGSGSDNGDDSGILRYVRIEFAGYDVSFGGNTELNALSSYAVGSATTYEFIEALAGLDDSFEFWGGAVDSRFLVSYESGDDHFDTSEGHVGRHQFLIGFQSTRLEPAPGAGEVASDPQGFEMDGCAGTGCDAGTRSEPFTNPIFANVTMVGNPSEPQTSGGRGLVLRRGHLGFLTNLILADWANFAVSVRDTSVTLAVRDSANVVNAILAGNGAEYEASTDPVFSDAEFATLFGSDNHRTAAAATDVITSITPGSFDWTPLGDAVTGCNTVTIPAEYDVADFFGGTLTLPAYCGAVAPGETWYEGWTSYATE